MIEAVKFAMHIIIHPIDGFWDMKYEKKGKPGVVFIIVILVVFSLIFERLVRGPIFNVQYDQPVDIMYNIRKVILPYFLFCIANWSVTTLMDGEGTIKDIAMSVGYSLTPIILIYLPLAVLTNFLTLREAAVVNFLSLLALIWSFLLLFLGVMTVHQYTVKKNIMMMVLSVLSMGIIIFIAMIFFSLITEITGFVYTVYKEFMMRL